MTEARRAHPNRVIAKVADDHWVISCRRCGKRTKQHRATAAECNEWHVEHSRTDYHRDFGKRAFDEKTEAFVRRLCGDQR